MWAPLLGAEQRLQLEELQRKAARVVTTTIQSSSSAAVLAEADLLPIEVLTQQAAARFWEKVRRHPEKCPLRRRLLCTSKDGIARHLRQAPDPLHVGSCVAPTAVTFKPVPPWNTSAAQNVRIHVQPCHEIKKLPSDELSKLSSAERQHHLAELRQANLLRYNSLPEGYVIVTDGSCAPAADGQEPRSSAAAILYKKQ